MNHPPAPKAIVFAALTLYIVGFLLSLLGSAINFRWIDGFFNTDSVLVIHTSYIFLSVISAIFGGIYFRLRKMNLQALSTIFISFIGVPLNYFLYIDKSSLFEPNSWLPVLGLIYLISFLFYGLSFVIPKSIRAYSYLRFYGVVNLLLLGLTIIQLFAIIPEWEWSLFIVSILSGTLMVLHYLKEQDNRSIDNEEVLDSEIL